MRPQAEASSAEPGEPSLLLDQAGGGARRKLPEWGVLPKQLTDRFLRIGRFDFKLPDPFELRPGTPPGFNPPPQEFAVLGCIVARHFRPAGLTDRKSIGREVEPAGPARKVLPLDDLPTD